MSSIKLKKGISIFAFMNQMLMTGYLAIVPSWFLGLNAIMNFLFAIITLVVSFYSFKVYRICGQRQSKLFGSAFLFISISYFVQSFVNLSGLSAQSLAFADIMDIHYLDAAGIFVNIAFFMLGLVTLAYMILKTKDTSFYWLFTVVIITTILFSTNSFFMFYLLSSILLFYICIHYLRNYLNGLQPKTLLVLIAFVFLLFGKIHFIFVVNHGNYYVIGQFLELVAYSLILANLILVVRKNEQKTR